MEQMKNDDLELIGNYAGDFVNTSIELDALLSKLGLEKEGISAEQFIRESNLAYQEAKLWTAEMGTVELIGYIKAFSDALYAKLSGLNN